MGPVGLPSHGIRTLTGLAVGLSGVESSSLPRDGASLAVAADEKVYRSPAACGPGSNEPSGL